MEQQGNSSTAEIKFDQNDIMIFGWAVLTSQLLQESWLPYVFYGVSEIGVSIPAKLRVSIPVYSQWPKNVTAKKKWKRKNKFKNDNPWLSILHRGYILLSAPDTSFSPPHHLSPAFPASPGASWAPPKLKPPKPPKGAWPQSVWKRLNWISSLGRKAMGCHRNSWRNGEI